MEHPSQLFDRIRRRKARPDLPRQGGIPVVPAPIQPAVSQAPASVEPSPPVDRPSPPPTAPVQGVGLQLLPSTPSQARPARSHALYSQVMRNHDRMGTRHL